MMPPEQEKEMLSTMKARLKKCIENGNAIEALRISQMVDAENQAINFNAYHTALLKEFQAALEKLERNEPITAVLEMTRRIFVKYDSFKMTRYISDWQCSRDFLSEKLTLSEDGLTISVNVSNGYPGIIGDVPAGRNLYAFEVIPEGLNCNDKEGFGIIDKDKYIEAYRLSPSTPVVYAHMIGFFYKTGVKNMEAESVKELQLGAKYFVKVDLFNLVMRLTGPGVSLRADLKPEVAYVPCFSCGCTGNKFRIRPLSDFHEELKD
eukprot:TRINITY_DN2402_c0_g2_i3.p1 TRINITY_DN2402_c0_g2~~TRINITY_DN2402_c0_g2_i3.p1  ORF type:complete len:264 (-),score=58.34 TRINITY_DN2402_c0_g2_i3:113-904(-)